jgi:NADH-quinone oxidoreductase subunit J
MGLALQYICFYVFAGMAIASAILMVTQRNPLHSAIFLLGTLLASAGLFLGVHAEFLFAVQVLVYAGGVVVFFLVTIMLVNAGEVPRQPVFNRRLRIAVILSVALGGEFGFALWKGGKVLRFRAVPDAMLPANPDDLARAVFQNHLLPFELISIVLLVAMIGAAIAVRGKTQ